MKKLFFLLTVALMSVACTQKESKALVVYFSATGNTKAVAEQLAEVAKADIWEIVPAEAYTAEDLDYTNTESRSSLEMSDPEARPMIKECTDVSAYDVIYVGFPIWWGVCPRIIDSWLENNILEGKKLIPFATSGTSAIDGCVEYLRTNYPELNWQDGRLLNGATAEDIEAWLKK